MSEKRILQMVAPSDPRLLTKIAPYQDDMLKEHDFEKDIVRSVSIPSSRLMRKHLIVSVSLGSSLTRYDLIHDLPAMFIHLSDYRRIILF